MADAPATMPASDPGEREGQVVSLDLSNSRDLGLLKEAIRRGWIKSLSRMDALVQRAIDAVDNAREIDAEDRAKLEVALGRLGATAASVYTRSMLAAEGKAGSGITIHGPVQFNIGQAVKELREAAPSLSERAALLERLEAEPEGGNGNDGKH
jgi:hypothetical protein